MEGQAGNRRWSEIFADEGGQDLVEYALVAAVIGLGAVAGLKGVATSVGTVFSSVGSTLTAGV